MDFNQINITLKQDYIEFSNYGYEIFGVFLYGSQNYGLDRQSSDIDVKIIYLDKPENDNFFISFRSEPYGQITLISMDEFLEGLEEGNHMSIEPLFSTYYFVNPHYRTLWYNIISLREKYISQRIEQIISVEIKYLFAQTRQMELANPSQLQEENKRLSYLYRIKYLIEQLASGQTYAKSIIPSKELKEYILWLKNNSPLTLEECKNQAHNICYSIKNLNECQALENNSLNNGAYEQILQLIYSSIAE